MTILLPLGIDGNSRLIDLAQLTVENAADSIFVMDVEGRTVFANPAAERTFGWSREELVGKILHDVVHHHYPDGRPFPMMECPLGQVFQAQRRLEKHEDVFFHRDGTPIHVACSNAPVMRNGEMVGAVLIAVDITERKRGEERQRLLTNELNHRVKNTLATVQAIVSQTLRSSPSKDDAQIAVEQRLKALARAHDVLTREHWQGAGLHDIVALAIAMALQELATNATKYGALSSAEGEVHLTWSVTETSGAPRLQLQWEERGGPPVSPPLTRGFGTRLIERSLAHDLDGSADIDFAPTGVVCRFEAPLG
ncbi:sensor histidine kinase [Microvirga lenta]|uniref:sensor histidine kinase n=1 Tax=Microvirga lenta TaxID=2881337 RepID=UPI001CFFDC9B|nr:HWE histidine kinase domain-containing protein [Microvirga lenta]MCB5176630.1 PAS domain S-box protein [Microvirga lenta]